MCSYTVTPAGDCESPYKHIYISVAMKPFLLHHMLLSTMVSTFYSINVSQYLDLVGVF